MTEEILAVCIPKGKSNGKDSISLNFLFKSENKEIITINNEDEFNEFSVSLDKIKFETKEDKTYYHIYSVIDYIKKFFKTLSRDINLESLEPSDCIGLYKVMARNGIITLINSDYSSLLFLPKTLSKNQKDSLSILSNIIDNDKKFSFYEAGDSTYVEGVNYSEILSYLDIENKNLKRGM